MRRYIAVVALLFSLSPASAGAQIDLSSPPPAPGLSKTVSPLLVTAIGVLAAAVVADIATRGALSGPVVRLFGTLRAPVGGRAAAAAGAAAVHH